MLRRAHAGSTEGAAVSSTAVAVRGGETWQPAVVPRPAATVIVVRDGPHPTAPLEVLMLQRDHRVDFVGGAHVFPGGGVDPGDGGPGTERLCVGLGDEAASATLGVASAGLAYWVAAVRECFEESGLLFASRADGRPISFADPGVAERLAAQRAALNARERSFLEVCESEGLVLAVGALHYFAHWITPEGSPRRYDTRFFVARAPEGQSPAHDVGEMVADLWVRPSDALERYRAGEMELILPTIENLQAIAQFPTAQELLDSASAAGEVPTVLPRMVVDGGGVRLLLPGDPGYDAPDGPGGPGGSVEIDFEAAVRIASRAASTQRTQRTSAAPVAGGGRRRRG